MSKFDFNPQDVEESLLTDTWEEEEILDFLEDTEYNKDTETITVHGWISYLLGA